MFFIYLDRIIMVYSHKTHALVKLEVENVLDLGILILIIINSITVSEECGIFNQQNLYPCAVHLSLSDAKKRELMSQATADYADLQCRLYRTD